jgi:hypothetical protein
MTRIDDCALAHLTRGERMHAWILAALSRGATVYLFTYTQGIKLTAKHTSALRLRDGHCELQRRRHWEIVDLCAVRATE